MGWRKTGATSTAWEAVFGSCSLQPQVHVSKGISSGMCSADAAVEQKPRKKLRKPCKPCVRAAEADAFSETLAKQAYRC